jgi:metal transporter CNNM
MHATRGAHPKLSVRVAARRPDDRPLASPPRESVAATPSDVSPPHSPSSLSDGWSPAASSTGFGNATVNIIIACALLVLSGLFSGLTLGLMSLDMVSLEILAEGGDEEEREYAKQIIPVREKGNLLLCTLLLGNTTVNALVAILMADLTDGLVGLLLSTFSIVVFGEIIPQAACSRHGLYIGANTVWLVKIFIVLMYVIAWPISMLLDRVLGRDIGQVFSADELHKLIRIHVENPDAQEESGLNKDDGNLLTGALEYKDKKVSDVMTTLDKVFMIESSTRLTFQVLMDIYKSGFTRIPVYEIDRQNIIGILFTKDLILIDPDDEVEIAAVISFHGNREGGFVRGVPDDTSLDKVFREFKSSYLHLLVAYGEVGPDGNTATRFDKDGIGYGNDRVANNHISDYTTSEYSLAGNRRVITGVITLEDVLEAVIKDEIVDETDNFIDVNKMETAVRGRGASSRSDPTNFLTLFEHRIRDQTKLSEAETAAITAFLSLNVPEFKKMARFGGVLKKLIAASTVEDIEDDEDANSKYVGTPANNMDGDSDDNTPLRMRQHSFNGTPSRQGSRNVAGEIDFSADDRLSDEFEGERIYGKGVSCDYFTLILQGKVIVHAGSDDFESELGPWCYVGQKALTTDPFVPDFQAHSHGSVRLLKIRRGDYKAAMRAAQVEAMSGSRSVAGSRHAAAGDSPDLSATVSPSGVSRDPSQLGLGSGSVVIDVPRSSTPPPKVP